MVGGGGVGTTERCYEKICSQFRGATSSFSLYTSRHSVKKKTVYLRLPLIQGYFQAVRQEYTQQQLSSEILTQFIQS